ncbi:hypothetical protein L3X38_041507 [Prunus dulcis]|uniref:Uncharacterized protein n=1 Tax=Prunus dulcis TaxID=3755 RepID=A0AAD4UUF8_PRUDU|nr:hypothetical protein L3X38_041507 [Prunus dulcis]
MEEIGEREDRVWSSIAIEACRKLAVAIHPSLTPRFTSTRPQLSLTLCSISSHTFFSLLLSREALGALLHSYLSLCEVVVFLFHRSPAKDYNGKTSRWP